ncbi:MAG: flagellar hook protein FlgE [Acidobacteriia bacterium]|nr:flagellar hook protein FlgE [Terriglobia bacterium]
MFNSFTTALTGLTAAELGVDVVGNNLANLNTTGFKASTVNFADIVAQSLGLGTSQTAAGLGAQATAVQNFTQGAIQTTNGAFDAAIQGDGFFIVRDPSGLVNYTRAGNFEVDANGNLVTQAGQSVQGWVANNGVLNTNGAIANIVIPSGALRQPTATTNMSINMNLDASATLATPQANFSTAVQVVDSLGTTHVLTVNFSKTAANTWSYNVTLPGEDVTAGTAGTPFPVASAAGSLTFDATGKLITPAPPPPATNGLVPVTIAGLKDGAADLAINWSLYSALGQPDITQYAQPSATASNHQDGLVAAELVHVTMTNGGEIIAQYSNGQQNTIAQIALASISNPDTLVSEGQNNFQIGPGTAPPAIGTPQTGGRGQVLGGSLESSTVDIATEFTRLIVMQRSYEANAKVITTTDTLTQDTINLKQ